jgi:hypothetical protein
MFHDWVVEKSRPAAALLALSLLASPAAAQPPAPPSPPDFTLRGAAPAETQPPRSPLVAREPSLCRDPLCRARIDGDLWKKGGVALSITPFSW